jgi:flagellar protein FlaG
MSDVPISHTLFLLVTIILVSAVSSVVIVKTYEIMSSYSQKADAISQQISTSLSIVYGYYNQSINGYVIYIRDNGMETLTQESLSRTQIYLGSVNSTMNFYIYNPSGGLGYWNVYKIIGGAYNEITPGSTVIVYVYTGANYGKTIQVSISLPNGQTFSNVVQSTP